MLVIIPVGLIVYLVRLCISCCVEGCNKCAAERRERQLRQQAEEYARQQAEAGAFPPTAPPPAGQSAYNAPPPKYTPRAAPSHGVGEKTPLMAENA